MDSNRLEQIWSKCMEVIRDNVPQTIYNTWFADIRPLKLENGELTIQVPSPFVYEYLEENYLDIMKMAITRYIGENTRLMYSVITDKINNIEAEYRSVNHTVPNYKEVRSADKNAPTILDAPLVQDLDPMLNPSYNFDSFIEGASNKLPRMAAETVSKNPGHTTFNPLFIYGESGVGKTHLANAIGMRVKELFPSKRVLYLSAHLFFMQYTDSVKNNTTNDFINFYQTIDVLIIDDMQEMEAYTKTQNVFFHIFNHLHLNQKQLIITSDRPPKELKSLDDRLITRFKWGLVAELERPDFELRKQILRDKTRRDGISLPEDVISYIASNITENVRDLEGVIISLLAYSTTFNKAIDLELAKEIIGKSTYNEEKAITMDSIMEKVCAYYGLDPESIQTKSRKHEVVLARQISMYLAKKYLDLSTSKIGMYVGKRDHATVLHAFSVVKDQMDVDKNFRADMENIERSIKC